MIPIIVKIVPLRGVGFIIVNIIMAYHSAVVRWIVKAIDIYFTGDVRSVLTINATVLFIYEMLYLWVVTNFTIF